MYKTPHSESTFVSADVEKLYATVAKSTFGSEHVKKKELRVREHFSKFRCRKIVRHCGETYILKSKCTKHDVFGPLLYVLMLKNARGCGERHISGWLLSLDFLDFFVFYFNLLIFLLIILI